jgi:hypothetical protein
MLQELLAMMTPEDRIAEFGTIEEKRRYIAEKRAENPNWENTIFQRGKAARGEAWVPCHRGVPKSVLQMMGGGHNKFASRFGARPERGRKARVH